MDKKEVIKIARRFLKYLKEKKFEITDAYLFGSYAKGTNQSESDIDIAIFFKELNDEIDMQIQLMKLRRKFDLRIEPHPFAKDDLDDTSPILHEILKTGISI